jgi:hypothetical protein
MNNIIELDHNVKYSTDNAAKARICLIKRESHAVMEW